MRKKLLSILTMLAMILSVCSMSILAFAKAEGEAETINVTKAQWLVESDEWNMYEMQFVFDKPGSLKDYLDFQNGLSNGGGTAGEALKNNLFNFVIINGKTVGAINTEGLNKDGGKTFFKNDGVTAVEPIRASWADQGKDS